MLKISVTPGSKVKMGENLFEVHTIYKDCIYIDVGDKVQRVGYNPVIIFSNSTVQFIRKKLRNTRAIIGLTSPHKIYRVPDEGRKHSKIK